VAGSCGLEAVSLCSAVRGDAGAEGERKWGNNGGRSEDGEECYPALPFVGCWLTAEDDAAAAAVVCSAGFVVEKRAVVEQGG